MTAVRRNKRKEHRSNSTKVAALTQLKAGRGLTQVSQETDIPPSTLKDWRRESMASHNKLRMPTQLTNVLSAQSHTA